VYKLFSYLFTLTKNYLSPEGVNSWLRFLSGVKIKDLINILVDSIHAIQYMSIVFEKLLLEIEKLNVFRKKLNRQQFKRGFL
jgi:hypothetical protein